MIYELKVDLFFRELDVMEKLVKEIDKRRADMIVVKPGHPDQECSYIHSIENHHDVDPSLPCNTLGYWDNCPVP